MSKSAIFHSFLLVSVTTTGATAQVFEEPVGFVGTQLNFSNITETRSPDSQQSYLPIVLEGQYAFPIFENGILGATGYYSYAEWDENAVNFDEDFPERELRLSLHYSHAITPDFRLGGFAAYSRSRLFGDDLQKESYETVYGGLEAQYFIGDSFMLFGQAGIGDSVALPPDQAMADPEGFIDGTFIRAGVTWFPVDSTAISLDLERAQTNEYLDGGTDSGDFYSVGLSGETRLPTEAPLSLTYFVRRDFYKISAGNIDLADVTAGIGLRILFGADTPRESWRNGRLLSAPRLPGRSVDWLEALD
ncbi:hypothetical protein E2K80_14665 [Rhodophyticola sp. CCM32]|uniref:hypothetical protein n=1 Tax=Rhodophyticola sp. CCM32 TaxID=2916397 RepID=UPI00107F8A1C|nr:hypothetical protein [Rhodophyticola sp. CCM32]QBY01813.1 hypothetical protein E2K80_14665 [Rhodophyticola sp. CCM32]